jgi:ABC-type multidrug transport system ATPase subunit
LQLPEVLLRALPRQAALDSIETRLIDDDRQRRLEHVEVDFLREINERGTTIILTTHYLEEAETLCRNIAIIDGGQIAERDRMSSLLRRLHVETFVLNLRCTLAAADRLEQIRASMRDPADPAAETDDSSPDAD